jgi:inorganic phosphate transporter, PiT family
LFLAYIYYMLVHGKKQTAIKESNMYKKLQLLSSAAFSLGHGGADSQKVMGIICAALMVYGNMGRDGKLQDPISEHFQISELMQLNIKMRRVKKKNSSQKLGVIDSITYYAEGDNLIDIKTQEVIFEDEKLKQKYTAASLFSSFEKADEGLEKLHVYT